MFIEDPCGVKCMTFMISSSPLNICMSRYDYFCIYREETEAKTSWEHVPNWYVVLAALNQLFDCKPVFFSAVSTPLGLC